MISRQYLVLCTFIGLTTGSPADRSRFYQNCISKCQENNCTEDGNFKHVENQEFFNWILHWSCAEECQYSCMWITVQAWKENGMGVPKFHGKWPFVRICGIQELGSVIGSLMNLLAHVHMYIKLRSNFSSKNTPLLWLWHLYAWVCIHGWIWSTIFHTRDTPFTEFMDYACALSIVLITFVTAVVRVLYGYERAAGVILCMTAAYYIAHVNYLYGGYIDYDYNIIANVIPGALTVILWTLWCVRRYRDGGTYIWKLVTSNVLASVLLVLEVFDFSPLMHLWDAHALWHVSTSVIPFFYYGFAFDDLTSLRYSWPRSIQKQLLPEKPLKTA